MTRKPALASLLVVFFFSTVFAFLGTKSAKAWGDICYCSDGDYYYNSYNGTEGTDYGWTNLTGYCPVKNGRRYSDWLRTECNDPYGEGNYAYWNALFYPGYPATVNWYNKVYVYIPSVTSTATGAIYSVSNYPNWPTGWPYEPTQATYSVNQNNYSNQWITFSDWFKGLDWVGARAYTSCPEGQQFNTDDIVQRYCADFNESTQTCNDSGFPEGFSPPSC